MISPFMKSCYEVFLLFVIPIGGGIPAGVILAKNRALPWFLMAFLYFLSDVLLACAFDPCMKLFIHYTKDSPKAQKFVEHYKASLAKTGFKFGLAPSPFSLIMISFGVDPMTGRAATHAAGYGFITGWSLAIAGDMIFFTLIAASTLLLNNILGDGTMAAIIIMVLMITIPMLIDKWKLRRAASSKETRPENG